MNLNKSSKTFGAYLNGEIVGFCAVLHFPHPKNAKIKRCHRLVVLPDYQGIGIGGRLLNRVGDYYIKNGFDFRIVTSTPSLAHSLKRTGWKLQNQGRIGNMQKSGIAAFNKTSSYKRLTLSLKYCPDMI